MTSISRHRMACAGVAKDMRNGKWRRGRSRKFFIYDLDYCQGPESKSEGRGKNGLCIDENEEQQE